MTSVLTWVVLTEEDTIEVSQREIDVITDTTAAITTVCIVCIVRIVCIL